MGQPFSNYKLKATPEEQTLEGRPEFSLKQSEVDSDSHKQVHHTFMRKPEFCSNQQALGEL